MLQWQRHHFLVAVVVVAAAKMDHVATLVVRGHRLRRRRRRLRCRRRCRRLHVLLLPPAHLWPPHGTQARR